MDIPKRNLSFTVYYDKFVNLLLYLLILSLLFQKHYFTLIPVYHLQTLFGILSVLLILFCAKNINLKRKDSYIISILMMIYLQQIISGIIYSSDPFIWPIKSVAPLVIVLLLYFCLRRQSYEDLSSTLLKAIRVIFLIVLAVGVIQLVYIYTLNSNLFYIINSLAYFLEDRWRPFEQFGNIHPFYVNGSYTTTSHRVNIFYAESAYFVVNASFLILPLLTAGIKFKKFFWKTFKLDPIVVSAFIWVIILMGGSTTGIIFSLATMALYILLQRRNAFALTISAAMLLVVLVVIFYKAGQITYLSKIADITNMSTNTRLATVIAGLRTILESPIIGYGKDIYERYIYNNLPRFSIGNTEIDMIVRQNGGLTVFNSIIILILDYGLPIFMAISILILRNYVMMFKYFGIYFWPSAFISLNTYIFLSSFVLNSYMIDSMYLMYILLYVLSIKEVNKNNENSI